jgi:hypothetical protein
MKIYDYRGQKVVLHPDAAQNNEQHQVVRKLQPDPQREGSYFLIPGATDLAFRHELKETDQEFTP